MENPSNSAGDPSPSAGKARQGALGACTRGTQVASGLSLVASPVARCTSRGRSRGVRGASKQESLSQPPPELPPMDGEEYDDNVFPRASKVIQRKRHSVY